MARVDDEMDRVGVFEVDAARRDSMDCIVTLKVWSCATFESSNAKLDDERSVVVCPQVGDAGEEDADHDPAWSHGAVVAATATVGEG